MHTLVPILLYAGVFGTSTYVVDEWLDCTCLHLVGGWWLVAGGWYHSSFAQPHPPNKHGMELRDEHNIHENPFDRIQTESRPDRKLCLWQDGRLPF